jgi:hypothetical protein
MKQLHWRNSYKPKHWRELFKGQKEKHAIIESHIFEEEKWDGKLKARKVVGGNKQCDYITKEDVSSQTVSAEAVMLTCVIDALEGRDVAVFDIPNAFVQTVVEDKEHCMIVCIRRPLVDILVNIAPLVYGPCVLFNKSGQKAKGVAVAMLECSIWNDGSSIAVLQEGFQELNKTMFQAQPI